MLMLNLDLERCMRKDCVDKNDSSAVEWFRKAAEQGNPYAQCRLGYQKHKIFVKMTLSSDAHNKCFKR